MEGSEDEVPAVAEQSTPAPRKFVTRHDVKVAKDRETVEVEVKEWGGFVRIVPMTGTMRAELEDRVEDKYKELPNGKRMKIANPAAKTYRERLLVDCCVDDDGRPLFEVKDIPWLAEKNARPVTIIVNAIMKLSGVSPEEQEELAKNSQSAISDAG